MKSDFNLCVFCLEVSHKDSYVCMCGEYKGLMPLDEGIEYAGLDKKDFDEYFQYDTIYGQKLVWL